MARKIRVLTAPEVYSRGETRQGAEGDLVDKGCTGGGAIAKGEVWRGTTAFPFEERGDAPFRCAQLPALRLLMNALLEETGY